MKFLEKLKAIFANQWTQVVQVVVAFVAIICAITGKVVDEAKVAVIVAQVGVAGLGVIWLIETIASAFSKTEGE